MVDSGATDHMTGNPNIFSNFRSHRVPSPVTIVDGSTYNIEGSATIKLTPAINLTSILRLPKLIFNLISISTFTNILIVVSHSFLIIVFFRIL